MENKKNDTTIATIDSEIVIVCNSDVSICMPKELCNIILYQEMLLIGIFGKVRIVVQVTIEVVGIGNTIVVADILQSPIEGRQTCS